MPEKPLKVMPLVGEPLRYIVQSHANPLQPYMVDLSQHDGNGACCCADWYSRRLPAINDGKPLFTRHTSCKHIIMARRHFTQTTLREMSRMIQQQEQPPIPHEPSF